MESLKEEEPKVGCKLWHLAMDICITRSWQNYWEIGGSCSFRTVFWCHKCIYWDHINKSKEFPPPQFQISLSGVNSVEQRLHFRLSPFCAFLKALLKNSSVCHFCMWALQDLRSEPDFDFHLIISFVKNVFSSLWASVSYFKTFKSFLPFD